MFELLEGLSREQVFASTISTIAIISGSLIGGICSWVVNKKSICRTEKIQQKILEDRIRYEESNKHKDVSENASLVSLDICTAIFQSIRSMKEHTINKGTDIYPIPIHSSYPNSVISLRAYLDLKELSYIYQLYGIIDKLNYDIRNCNYLNKDNYDLIIKDYEMLIRKLYGENIIDILAVDIDKMTYEAIYLNNFIKTGYKNVLMKLEGIGRGK